MTLSCGTATLRPGPQAPPRRRGQENAVTLLPPHKTAIRRGFSPRAVVFFGYTQASAAIDTGSLLQITRCAGNELRTNVTNVSTADGRWLIQRIVKPGSPPISVLIDSKMPSSCPFKVLPNTTKPKLERKLACRASSSPFSSIVNLHSN